MKSAFLEAADTVDGVIKVLYHNGYRLALEESQENDAEYCWYLSKVNGDILSLEESGCAEDQDNAWENAVWHLFSRDVYEPVLGALKICFPRIPQAWQEVGDEILMETFFEKIGGWDTGIVTAYEEGPYLAYGGKFYREPNNFFEKLKMHAVDLPLAHSVAEAENTDFKNWYFKSEENGSN